MIIIRHHRTDCHCTHKQLVHCLTLSVRVGHCCPAICFAVQGIVRAGSEKAPHIPAICICPQVSDILDLHHIEEKFSTYKLLLLRRGQRCLANFDLGRLGSRCSCGYSKECSHSNSYSRNLGKLHGYRLMVEG